MKLASLTHKLLLTIVALGVLFPGAFAQSGPGKVAGEDFDGGALNLIEGFNPTTDNLDGGPGDFFGVANIGSWPQAAGVPFSLADDSRSDVSGAGVLASDTEGVFGDQRDVANGFFGISDSDEFGGGQTASWTFDVAGFENLELLIDMGGISDGTQFGGFVPQTATFAVSVDGGATQTAFSLAATTNTGSFTYRAMDIGTITSVGGVLEVTGDNPVTKLLAEDGSEADNTFLDKTPSDGAGAGQMDTYVTSLNGTGSTVTVTLTTDFAFEAMAFDNIEIVGTPVSSQVDPVLLISGVLDAPLTGGIPKLVELYAATDINDLSVFSLRNYNNGGTSITGFTTLTGSVSAGDFIYVVNSTTEQSTLDTWFGTGAITIVGSFTGSEEAIQASGNSVSINGDDAFELFNTQSGTVVDLFGVIGIDGSGEPWEYLDGWAYRRNGTDADADAFELGNWNFSGPNALDNEVNNANAAVPFPLATFELAGDDPNNGNNELPFVESFEEEPGTNYALSNQFDDGSFDFFNRYSVPEPAGGNAARDDFQQGWDQSFGIIGQDHDGDGFNATQTVTIPNINISGATNLNLSLAVGALNSEPSFENYEAADNDGIEIYATIDGGSRVLVASFAPEDAAGDLFLDTDLDGVGEGGDNNRLTTVLRDFSFFIPGTGSSLTLEIELTSNDSFEPLAIDNVRVEDVDDAAPTVVSTDPADGDVNVLFDTPIEITFSEAVNIAGTGFSVVGSISGDVSAGYELAGGPTTYSLNRTTAAIVDEDLTVTFFSDGVTDIDAAPTNLEADFAFTFSVVEELPITFIHEIQGSGLESELVGNIVTIEGIVTGDFQGVNQLQGFYVQEEESDYDTDETTSEGIFIFEGASSLVNVVVGDKVLVTGTVTETSPNKDGLTSLIGVSSVVVLSQGEILPSEIALSLPAPSLNFFERVEGMRVNFTQDLFGVDFFNYGRYNEARISGNPFLQTATNIEDPGTPEFVAANEFNLRNQINLDDNQDRRNAVQNRNDLKFTVNNDGVTAPRRGAKIAGGISGIVSDENRGEEIGLGFASYVLRPTNPDDFFFTENPEAPTEVPSVGGELTVATYNVLNYFTTFGSRGAFNSTEFARQQQKLAASFVKLNADVVGLQEMENNAASVPSLVGAINGVNGFNADVYDFIATGAINRSDNSGDEIKVALIYKKDVVEPVGNFAVLNNAFDPKFFDNSNRPILAQTFREISTGEIFTVAVAHLKSKGSDCALNEIEPGVFDVDTDDGQSSCNLTRESAAKVLDQWLATDPTNSGDPDFLFLGDLNSYAMEDPVTALKEGGFISTVEEFNTSDREAYSFVFGGPEGTLDYVLANGSMFEQVTGADIYHINADFARALDNKTFNQSFFFQPDEFRSADHDPVIVGLTLGVDDRDQVASFQLVDNRGNVLVESIEDNSVIDLANFSTTRFDIRAITDPAEVGSVIFELNGPKNADRTENIAPYELFGGNAQELIPGEYTLTATPFSESNSNGDEGAALTITFEVILEQSIENFQLVDNQGNVLVESIEEGSVIDLTNFSATRFDIRAITDPSQVGSVVFALTGPKAKNMTENVAPYELFGGNAQELVPGIYTLTATPYSQSNGNGVEGTSLTVNFELTLEQIITRFQLTDRNGNVLVEEISGDAPIVLSELPTDRFNIRAVTSPEKVGSVAFELSGAKSRTQVENIEPYDLFGTGSSTTLPVGTYRLSATPFSQSNKRGVIGISLTVNFEVVKDASVTITQAGSQYNTRTRGVEGTPSLLPSGLTVYPNPASDKVNLSLENELIGKLTTRILDPLGKVVRQVELTKEGQRVEQQIDLNGLAKGIYFIQVVMDDYKANMRFVISE